MLLPPTAPELDTGEIASRLRDGLGDGLAETLVAHDQVTARVKPEAWVEAARFLKSDDSLRCTFFSWLSAIHWVSDEATPSGDFQPFPPDHEPGSYAQPRGNLFQVLALVSSPRRGVAVLLKTEIPEDQASIESLTDVYAGANWHERECHEMFGIDFEGHPDLAKLYLPEDFEGHPLLKSFPLGARDVKPWPGNIDVEDIPPEIEARLVAELGGGSSEDGDSE